MALALLVASLIGCQRGPEAPVEASVASPTRDLQFELIWQGVLPCADCSGIESRLLLRRAQDIREFELQETFLGVDQDNQFIERGEWREKTVEIEGVSYVVYQLDPDQRGLQFRLLADGSLELLNAAGQPQVRAIEYRLQRQ